MSRWKYAFQGYDKENMARAAGVYLPASFKYLREVGKFIKGKLLIRAIAELKEISQLKRPLPLKKYNKDVGHKKGIAAGRYSVKTVSSAAGVLENALANAREKGLNETRLVIIHVSSSKSVAKERRRGKIANFEVVVAESEEKVKKEKKVKKLLSANKLLSKGKSSLKSQKKVNERPALESQKKTDERAEPKKEKKVEKPKEKKKSGSKGEKK